MRTSLPEQAVVMLQEALAGFRELEDQEGIAHVLSALGLALRTMGDHESAYKAYRESLIVSSEVGYRWAMIDCLVGFAALSASKEGGAFVYVAKDSRTVRTILGYT